MLLYLVTDVIFKEFHKNKEDILIKIQGLNIKEDGKIKCQIILENKKIIKEHMKVII